MKLDFTQINGKEIPVSKMEFLYTYKNDEGQEIAVFEYEGERIERKVLKDE